MSRSLRLLVVCVSALVAAVSLGATAASAHTEVQRATPGPGEQVAGRVDQVELVFLDPVQPGLDIEVVDGDDAPVAGLESARLGDDGRVARVRFDALTTIGSYVVTYGYTALDGARQRGSYSFRFTGGGADEVPVGLADPDDPGSAGVIGLVAFVSLAVAAGVAARFRAQRAAGDD